MKPDIHPDYHPVVFQDAGTGKTFLIRSTVTSDRTIDYQGATYPLVVVDVTGEAEKRVVVDALLPRASGYQRLLSEEVRSGPLRFSIRSRWAGSSSTLTSLNVAPLRCSKPRARSQYGHQPVEYIVISGWAVSLMPWLRRAWTCRCLP